MRSIEIVVGSIAAVLQQLHSHVPGGFCTSLQNCKVTLLVVFNEVASWYQMDRVGALSPDGWDCNATLARGP